MPFLPLKKILPAKLLDEHGNLLAEKIICGIDEVGRGPWAGPVVGCALTLPQDVPIYGCADSKMLTAGEREKVYKKLEKVALFGVGIVQASEIDKLGLIRATNLSFVRALDELVKKLGTQPSFLLVDGRDRLSLPCAHKSIIKGDQKIKLIAAASIIAKVVRDRLMGDLAKKYPQYGFDENKGYGTLRHQKALREFGMSHEHRRSFKPVHNLFQMELF